jgi:hypothetical protein
MRKVFLGALFIGVCGRWTTWLVTRRHRLDRYFQGSPDVALEWFAPVVLSFCAADIHVAAAILDRPAGAGVLRTDVLRPSAREAFALGLDRRSIVALGILGCSAIGGAAT